MGCSKPNCDCLEKEEQRIGSPVKYGYPCLGDRFKGDEIKSPEEETCSVCGGTGKTIKVEFPSEEWFEERMQEILSRMQHYQGELKAQEQQLRDCLGELVKFNLGDDYSDFTDRLLQSKELKVAITKAKSLINPVNDSKNNLI